MSLPPLVQARIERRFEELIAESEQLVKQMHREDTDRRQRASANGVQIGGEIHVAEEAFYSLQMKSLSLIDSLSIGSQHLAGIYGEIKGLQNKESHAKKLSGILLGIQNDFVSGMLDNISRMIEANIVSDYLGQAENLLKEGQPGKYDHVPAAVLAGAVLEDALRRLCQRQNPPIPVDKPNSEPKTLGTLIADLQKVEVYNSSKGKQLIAWAATRNHAAHGEFTEFNRQDVEQMLLGVQNFLADYM